ncbi:ependymin-like [Diretmus argenteus]
MRGLVLLACLAVGCLAQRPRPCKSPPLLTGRFSMVSPLQNLTVYAKYSYDAMRQRIRLGEIGSYDNKIFHVDVLLLYKQCVLYKINHQNRSCCKKRLCAGFHPLAIPGDASFLGQVVLGSSSGPGQGVWVNTWAGEREAKKSPKVQYMSTVTEYGCIPISTLFHSDRRGWVITSFFDNVEGIADPDRFVPPSYCEDARLEEEDGEEPTDFYNLMFE